MTASESNPAPSTGFACGEVTRCTPISSAAWTSSSPDDTPFDAPGIETLRNGETGSCEDLARRLLRALHGHAASDELAHDDVTFLLAEFVEGPPGPALWHVFKHRLLRQERR